MKTKKIILIFLVLFTSDCFSQSNRKGYRFWKLTYVSGEVKAKGSFRDNEVESKVLSYLQKSSYYMGGANIKTQSFLLNPNFLTLDVDAGYYPESSRNKYIVVIPNQAEVRTTKKIDIKATLLKQEKLTLSSFTNLNETYQNRENLTDIKSNSNQWGGALNYSNKFLPLSVSFRKRQWEQKEILTPRKLNMDEWGIQSSTTKSFTSRDVHEISYSYNEFVNKNENLYRTANIIENISLNDNVFIDRKKNYFLNSMISNYTQRGNTNFKRFQVLENLNFKLPKNISFSQNYKLNLTQQEFNKLNQQSIQSSLAHQLLLYLNSRFFVDYNQTTHTEYNEHNYKIGLDFKYTKRIPANGRLVLMYTYFRWQQEMNSKPVSLQVRNEEYILADTSVILLKRPNVNPSTVVVKNVTGAITYQVQVDYILIERNKYIEIRRVPGGLIADNTAVYIDYLAVHSGSYKYYTNNHTFDANISLFKQKLEVYYRISSQDNNNLNKSEFLTLNYFTQNLIGGRLDFHFINGGAEYEEYRSSFVPYRRVKYFFNIQNNSIPKLVLTLNGNIQNYQMIHERENRQYSDITAKIAYVILRQTNINLDLMYRNQKGNRINLDLYTAKGEIISIFKQMYLSFGLEIYRRNFVGERIKFKGTYISITRKF